jgi:hypothetical protein
MLGFDLRQALLLSRDCLIGTAIWQGLVQELS